MLKKFAVVTMGVTAGLAGLAPLASAHEDGHGTTTNCESQSDDQGNVGLVNECNVVNQHNFTGATFNGQPIENPLDVSTNDVPAE